MSVEVMSCNGVRQGGILSPYLFVYMHADELSRILNNINAGYFVGCDGALLLKDIPVPNVL